MEGTSLSKAATPAITKSQSWKWRERLRQPTKSSHGIAVEVETAKPRDGVESELAPPWGVRPPQRAVLLRRDRCVGTSYNTVNLSDQPYGEQLPRKQYTFTLRRIGLRDGLLCSEYHVGLWLALARVAANRMRVTETDPLGTLAADVHLAFTGMINRVQESEIATAAAVTLAGVFVDAA